MMHKGTKKEKKEEKRKKKKKHPVLWGGGRADLPSQVGWLILQDFGILKKKNSPKTAQTDRLCP